MFKYRIYVLMFKRTLVFMGFAGVLVIIGAFLASHLLKSSQPLRFQREGHYVQVDCRIYAYAAMVSVCSKHKQPLQEVVVQVNGRFLFPIRRLQPGECVNIPKHKFVSTDSSRNTSSPNMLVTTGELTAVIDGVGNGYCSPLIK
jgi:hypothetical protein